MPVIWPHVVLTVILPALLLTEKKGLLHCPDFTRHCNFIDCSPLHWPAAGPDRVTKNSSAESSCVSKIDDEKQQHELWLHVAAAAAAIGGVTAAAMAITITANHGSDDFHVCSAAMA